MNAVMYVDGSCHKTNNLFLNGYGVVLLVGDQHHELSEGVVTNQNQVNSHEHYAFLHGLELAVNRGVDLTELTVFCDDQMFGYANTWLHGGNYSRHSCGVRKAVSDLRRATGEQSQMLLWFLEHGRTHKLKGHSGDVYQERVDYLAKHAAYRASGVTDELLPYDDWLKRGFKMFDHVMGHHVTVYPPFVERAQCTN